MRPVVILPPSSPIRRVYNSFLVDGIAPAARERIMEASIDGVRVFRPSDLPAWHQNRQHSARRRSECFARAYERTGIRCYMAASNAQGYAA